MNSLVFSNGELMSLREQLLASREETAAIVLARAVRSPRGWRLVASDVILAPSEAYSKRGHDHIELRPEFIAPVLKRARHERRAVVLVHTHPFPGSVAPSLVDQQGELILLPTIFSRVPGLPHGRLIIGPDGSNAALFTEPVAEEPLAVIEVGREIKKFERLSEAFLLDRERFDRQVRAFGPDGQATLEAICVGIVGLGGTGSVVAQQLAHLGVKRYVLIDPDLLERTNLNRVVGAKMSDVGKPKVDVASAAIRQIVPGAVVDTICDTALMHRVVRNLLDVDVFFGCTDTHGSRAVLSQFAYQYLIPCIDMGVQITASDGRVDHISGRVQMLSPGLPCLVCADLLDPDQVRRDLLTEAERRRDPYIVGEAILQPAVISLNSAIASLAVTMFLSAATGLPDRARHQVARFEAGVVRAISGEQVPNCVVCSKNGALGRGDDWSLPGRL
jgi:molybdopterin/thiamine biosynthesis adenylyltransferase